MSLSNPRLLVIEDEPSQVELLRYNLTKQGFDVRVAMDGEEGVDAAREDPPDLILLDWMLPNLSGIEVCRQLRRDRATREVPIIMLTARSEERDKVRGLDVGADDYVTKPYSVKELIARVRAALRRPAARVADSKLVNGKIEIDLEKHTVKVAGKDISLSPTEFRLLVTLMQSPGRVFSRDQLLDMVWGITADVDTRTVDVHVGRLRRVLDSADGEGLIRTIRGFGYALSAE
ncbi:MULTISPECIES: phosphate regulon transcriptional regulator PhoB [unclassified Roseovarius]|uniref:phosphate regulon transcriptional regulator PhoB n=1 Tax=unclassified Roseovarius TaxID=2614913 RepID=UPI00273F2E9F|nr:MULTISPECIES: phosphate regulon transcriptional regulator PhoB [unclassified Roseovarius]